MKGLNSLCYRIITKANLSCFRANNQFPKSPFLFCLTRTSFTLLKICILCGDRFSFITLIHTSTLVSLVISGQRISWSRWDGLYFLGAFKSKLIDLYIYFILMVDGIQSHIHTQKKTPLKHNFSLS